MAETKKTDILLLGDPQSGPPPQSTDMFFSERARVRSTMLDSLSLGIAIGLGCGIMFLLILLTLRVLDLVNLLAPVRLNFLQLNVNPFWGVIIGLLLISIFGFLFGLIIAMSYNSFVRKFVLENESWETFA